jgi:chloramphenicol O-acetyltransferase
MPTSALDSEKTLCHVLLAVNGLSPRIISKTLKHFHGGSSLAEIPAAIRVVTTKGTRKKLELAFDNGYTDFLIKSINEIGREGAISFSIKEVQTHHINASPYGDQIDRQKKIQIDTVTQRLFCGGREVKFSPQLFAWYVWMVKRCLLGHSELRCARWTDAGIAQEFLREYRQVVGAMTHYYENAACLLAGGMTQEFFQEKKARVNRKLFEALREASDPYLIKATGRRPTQKFGLLIAADCIEIV